MSHEQYRPEWMQAERLGIAFGTPYTVMIIPGVDDAVFIADADGRPVGVVDTTQESTRALYQFIAALNDKADNGKALANYHEATRLSERLAAGLRQQGLGCFVDIG